MLILGELRQFFIAVVVFVVVKKRVSDLLILGELRQVLVVVFVSLIC